MLCRGAERVVQDTREELGLQPAGVETEDGLLARGGYGSPTIVVNGDDLYFGNDGLVLVREALWRTIRRFCAQPVQWRLRISRRIISGVWVRT